MHDSIKPNSGIAAPWLTSPRPSMEMGLALNGKPQVPPDNVAGARHLSKYVVMIVSRPLSCNGGH